MVFLPLGLSNHRQLPMLAGCQNGKAVLARFVLHFMVTGALESHAGGCTSCMPAGGKPWPIWLLLGRGCFQKGAVAPFDPFHVATEAASAVLFALSLTPPNSLPRLCPFPCSCSCTAGNS